MDQALFILDKIQKNADRLECILENRYTDIAYQELDHLQGTSYRTGDEGYRIANGLLNLNNAEFPKYTQALDSLATNTFVTLKYDNAFGNKDRFTDIDGLQVYGDGIVVDHLTKRMYYEEVLGPTDWDASVDVFVSSTKGGFDNWFLVTRSELNSVMDYNDGDGTLTFGSITVGVSAKTSTTWPIDTTRSYARSSGSVLAPANKTSIANTQYGVRIFDESELNIP